ncbi:MAG: beta strand repeat-containing protein, partial [Chitinophagaceae bacterium]
MNLVRTAHKIDKHQTLLPWVLGRVCAFLCGLVKASISFSTTLYKFYGLAILMLLQFSTTSISAQYNKSIFSENFIYQSYAVITAKVLTGNWNDPNTWEGGVVPTSADNVIIPTGANIHVNTSDAACNNITILGSLTINGSNTLTVTGNWVNNGSFSSNTGTVIFSGATNVLISGTSPTAFYQLNISKSSLNVTVEANGAGLISNQNNLTINGGVLKITTGNFQFIGNTTQTIPQTGSIWVNGGTFTSQYSVTNEGVFRISNGTANIGTLSGHFLEANRAGSGAFNPQVLIEGGSFNVAGRLTITDYSSIVMTGGTVVLNRIGLATVPSFEISASSSINFSGGTIIFQNPNTGIDLSITTNSSGSVSGGTFQFGNSNTSLGSLFQVSSSMPLHNIIIDGTNGSRLQLASNIQINNLLTLNGHLLLGTLNLTMGANAPSIAGSFGATSGMIITNGSGEVRKNFSSSGSYFFPIGDNTGVVEYSPVTINFTGGSFASGAYAGVRVVNSKHPNNLNNTDFLNRHWFTTFSGITNPVYNLTATYLAADVVGSDTRISPATYASVTWTKNGTINTGSRTINLTGLISSVAVTGVSLCDPPTIFNVTGGGVYCAGGSGVSINLSGSQSEFTYQLFNGTTAIGNAVSGTGNALTFANITTAGNYTVVASHPSGCTGNMNGSVTVSVNPVIAGNTISADQSICTGTTPAQLTGATPTGGDGSTYTYQWQSSTTGASSGFANVTTGTGATAPNYTPTALTATTWYRRVVTSGGCIDNSAAVQITVNPVISNNTVGAAQTICTGTAPAALA